ncbi:MAG: LemA family protein, partial [Deltaproteobacteria bacterium]|nr:LemA family protein [Deltaproteobacteria bacterium]
MRNPKKIANFILNAYSKRYNLRSPQVAVSPYPYDVMDGRERYRQLLSFARRNTFWIGLLILMTLLSYIAVYYYNLLVDTQQNMFAYRGNVETMLQRRNDIANNLSKAVLDYSAHEREVFTAVVSLRSFISKDNPEKDDYLKKLGQTFGQQKQTLPFEKGSLEAAKDENFMSSLSKLM